MKVTKRVGEELGLPPGAVGGECLVHITGRGRVLVESHCGLREITPQRVRIATRKGVVNIVGDQLLVRQAQKDDIAVEGRIDRVELE